MPENTPQEVLDMIQLGQDIAPHLPSYQTSPRYCTYVHVALKHAANDDRTLIIDTQDRKKYSVSVCWPHSGSHFFRPDDYGSYSIGVSKSRGLEVLASEITRRLLGRYHVAYAECLQELQEYENRDSAERELRDELLRALGREDAIAYLGDDIRQFNAYGHGFRNVRVNGVDSVQFETMSLSRDVAFELIEFLKVRANKHILAEGD